MSHAHYFYLPLTPFDLDLIVKAHQLRFDEYLADNFDDAELKVFESMIDSISAVYVQPLLSELSFDDFYAIPSLERQQRFFFESCQSTIVLENLPYFESNPFQVSYLVKLLACFDEVLIDQGGVNEVVFKDSYLSLLGKHKKIEDLFQTVVARKPEIKSSLPVDPIDFLILDVYKEIERLQVAQRLPDLAQAPSEKCRKIFSVMLSGHHDSTALFMKAGLIAKDFDDNLERLKFWLRKLS